MKRYLWLVGLAIAVIVVPLTSQAKKNDSKKGLEILYASDLWLLKTNSTGDTLWTKTYDFSFEGNCIRQTKDGGYIIAAREGLIKTDSLGDTLWTHAAYAYMGLKECMECTSDGCYIVTGSKFLKDTQKTSLWLLKVDSLGKTLWERTDTLGGVAMGWAVAEATDGGYVLVGDVSGFVPTGQTLILLKTTAQGDTLWTRIYEGAEYSAGHHIQRTTDGGYVIVGVEDGDMLVIKTDSLGEKVWKHTYRDGSAWFIRELSQGGYLVTGELGSRITMLRIDSQGDSVWTKQFTLPGYAFQETKDGGFIFVGVEGFPEGNYDYNFDLCLLRLDSLGNVLWKSTYGGPYSDGGNSVQITSDGSYIIVGSRDLRRWIPPLEEGKGESP